MTFRSRRLEELLGGTLDAITHADIAGLGGNPDAAEAEDLDYKQAHYTGEPKSREELAKDVAAFANHLGGLIIVGMAEVGGVPSKVFDVSLDDVHLRHLQQRIASSTAPVVRWHPIRKENPGTPGKGFLIIAVPRSPQAPHAITVPPTRSTTDALRYPRRSGTKTDWQTETYVATAYHQRFTALTSRQDRMKDLQQGLASQERNRDRPHLIVTLVPDVPGDMPINQESFERHERDLHLAQPLLGLDDRPFSAVSVQAKALMLHSRHARARSDLAYLYTDGSGIWAQPLSCPFDEDDAPDERVRALDADLLVHRLLSALAFLGTHARDRCGATGTTRVEVDLVDRMYSHPWAPPEPILRPGQMRPAHLYPLVLHQHGPYPSSGFACRSAQAEASALLDDIADAGASLVQACAPLADQLFHPFGIAEASPTTRQGEFRTPAWEGPLRTAITSWASQNGAPQVDG